MVVKEYDSPLGLLYLASIGNELCLCSWQGLAACHEFLRQHGAESDYGQEWTVVERARKELDEYFDGDREEFESIISLCKHIKSEIGNQAKIPYRLIHTFIAAPQR